MDGAADLFISYRHRDSDAADALVVALQRQRLRVWIDRSEIPDGASIQRRIDQGLAQARALLAWYSRDYPVSRACQWEITAAVVAARAETAPVQRVLVVNPEADDKHILLNTPINRRSFRLGSRRSSTWTCCLRS